MTTKKFSLLALPFLDENEVPGITEPTDIDSEAELTVSTVNTCGDLEIESSQLTETTYSPSVTDEANHTFLINDLGLISHTSLSDDQKYSILTSQPPKLKAYPMNIQKRRFQHKWTQEFPWIRYSESEDGIYCAPCFLFSDSRFNDEFVKSPFKDWKNATGTSRGTLCRHSSSPCHLRCKEQAVTFIAVMERRRPSVKSHLSDAYSKQVEQNTKALLSIIDAIQFLVKQGLPLRGHHWNKDLKREDGNLSKLIDFLSSYCSDLNSHLHTSAKNARYLSPKIQNEFISLNADLI